MRIIDEKLEKMYLRITHQIDDGKTPDNAEVLYLLENLYTAADDAEWALTREMIKNKELKSYIEDWKTH